MSRSRISVPSLEQIVRRAHILVVDDQDFPYEVLFERGGYNITKWSDIDNLHEIEQGKFDIILLDLQGIGAELTKDQGLGVLKHIKMVRPSQVVVAYSNADWGVQYQPFFDLADRKLAKSADFVDFKREVDDLLLEHFSLGFHTDRLNRTLEEEGLEGIYARWAVRRAVRGKPEKLRALMRRRGLSSETIQTVSSLVQVAMQVGQVWTSGT